MIGLLIAIFLGIIFGCLTGITPGIHVNTICALIMGLISSSNSNINVLQISIFIMSMALTHTFLDIIPTVYLGAPSSESFLGVLPGHRYLLQGWGYMAVKLNLIGSFFGLVVSLILMFPAYLLIKYYADFISNGLVYIMLVSIVFLIVRDSKKIWSIIIFMLSGCLGILVFRIYNLSNPLFAMLSGLFGISTLIYSLNEKSIIPKQEIMTTIKLRKKVIVRAAISSSFAGWLTSILPGLGSSQAAAMASAFAGKIGDHGFMVLLGGVNTVNFVMSIATLFALGKARNGAIITIKQLLGEINISHVILFIPTLIIVGASAVFLTLLFSRLFSKYISKINYKVTIIFIIILIFVLTILLSGFTGLIILVASTALGLMPAIVKCSRTHAMGCIMVPVILSLL